MKVAMLLIVRRFLMSTELKRVLYKHAEETCKKEIANIDNSIERLKEVLLKFAKVDKWDFPTSIEGAPVDFKQHEQDFQLLERSGLLSSTTKFTERTSYIQYKITTKGKELLSKLKEEQS
jgi:hypothetical protein